MKRSVVLLLVTILGGAAQAASFEEGLELKKQSKLPEAEAVFAEVVKEEPTNAAALEQWATVLGWLGRHDEAIAVWHRALAEKPDEPGYVMGLARVEYWKGELPPARERMEKLIGAAPENADALALAGDICSAQKDLSCAREHYSRAQSLAPSAELTKKLDRSAGPLRQRFDAGGQLDAYDGDSDRGTEGSFFAQGSWQALDPLVISAGYEQLHQFGKIDHRFNGGLYFHPVDRLLLSGRVAISPTADTIAPWEASGGAELAIVGPLTALANVRHLDFDNQGVTIIGGGVRVTVGRVAITGQGGAVYSTINDLQGFGSGRVEVAVNDAVHAYAGFSRGVEAQLLLPSETATDVTAGLTWQIDRRFGVRLDYTYETFGDIYVRNSVGSALTFKF